MAYVRKGKRRYLEEDLVSDTLYEFRMRRIKEQENKIGALAWHANAKARYPNLGPRLRTDPTQLLIDSLIMEV